MHTNQPICHHILQQNLFLLIVKIHKFSHQLIIQKRSLQTLLPHKKDLKKDETNKQRDGIINTNSSLSKIIQLCSACLKIIIIYLLPSPCLLLRPCAQRRHNLPFLAEGRRAGVDKRFSKPSKNIFFFPLVIYLFPMMEAACIRLPRNLKSIR